MEGMELISRDDFRFPFANQCVCLWLQTVQYGGVEGYWGVFDSKYVVFCQRYFKDCNAYRSFNSKQLKSGVTIPDCSHS